MNLDQSLLDVYELKESLGKQMQFQKNRILFPLHPIPRNGFNIF